MALQIIETLISKIDVNLSSSPSTIKEKKRRKINYKVEILQKQHVEEAKMILIDAFAKRTKPMNPLCLGANVVTADTFGPFAEYFVENAVLDGLSNVAVDTDANNKVIGVVIADDQTDEMPDSLIQKLVVDLKKQYNANWEFILEFLDELTLDFNEQKKRQKEWKKGNILHLNMCAVHKDYQRCGVVTKLKNNLVEIAKANGFKYILSEAVITYAQRQALKIGFKIVNELYYAKWEYPKNSAKYPFAFAAKETGFDKACCMIYTV